VSDSATTIGRGRLAAALIGFGGLCLAISVYLPWARVVLIGNLSLMQLANLSGKHSLAVAAVVVGVALTIGGLLSKSKNPALLIVACLTLLVGGRDVYQYVHTVSHYGAFVSLGAGSYLAILAGVLLVLGIVMPSGSQMTTMTFPAPSLSASAGATPELMPSSPKPVTMPNIDVQPGAGQTADRRFSSNQLTAMVVVAMLAVARVAVIALLGSRHNTPSTTGTQPPSQVSGVGQPRVLVYIGTPQYKPTGLYWYASLCSSYVKNLTWTSWTANSATAIGTLMTNDGVPNCAQGTWTAHGDYPVSLSRPQEISYCSGKVLATANLYTYTNLWGGSKLPQYVPPCP
jgi:hypothetical protein